MEIPVINASQSTVVEAVTIPAKTYDRYWLASCVIQAFDLNKQPKAEIELVKYRQTESGGEAAPEPSVIIKVEDLFDKAAADPDLATVMGLLLQYVIKIGKEKGLVS
jgi:hypothetical protein